MIINNSLKKVFKEKTLNIQAKKDGMITDYISYFLMGIGLFIIMVLPFAFSISTINTLKESSKEIINEYLSTVLAENKLKKDFLTNNDVLCNVVDKKYSPMSSKNTENRGSSSTSPIYNGSAVMFFSSRNSDSHSTDVIPESYMMYLLCMNSKKEEMIFEENVTKDEYEEIKIGDVVSARYEDEIGVIFDLEGTNE